MTTQDNFAMAPALVRRYLVLNEVPEGVVQSAHERSARRNAVRVEPRLGWKHFAFLARFFLLHLGLLRRTETSSALLVHLCARCDTIDGQEEQLLRLNHVEERLQVKENVFEDLLFCNSEVDVIVVGVTAIVNHSVHV